MDKFCEDCIHNEVCQYYAIPPHIGRCNDKDTLDDIMPRGEWIANPLGDYVCNKCSWVVGKFERNFCPNCGAKMKGGAE